MLPSNGGDVGMVEEEGEVQLVEGARQQVGPHGMRTPGENLRILLAQKKAGKSSWWRWLEPVLVQKQGDEYPKRQEAGLHQEQRGGGGVRTAGRGLCTRGGAIACGPC